MFNQKRRNDILDVEASFYNILLASCHYTPKIKSLIPEIRNVIFNEPATIVFWADGTKTVVKAHGENFDPEKGLAMAISKKALGNEGNYFNKIKKWANQYKENKVSLDLILPELAFSKLGDAVSRLKSSFL